MRSMFAVLAGVLMLSGAASAQSAQPTSTREVETGYVEGVAQSSFGNVTSQSFGAEAGVNLGRRIRVFAEVGRVRDTAPASLGSGAQLIAGYLTQVQSAAVSFSVRQPALFGSAGVRYLIPYDERIEPYVLGGFGYAQVKRDVRFAVGGSDVTEAIATYGVALGSDLSGTETKPLMMFGGGVVWNFSSVAFADAQYRFGRIFTAGEAMNLSRIGLGVGVRF